MAKIPKMIRVALVCFAAMVMLSACGNKPNAQTTNPPNDQTTNPPNDQTTNPPNAQTTNPPNAQTTNSPNAQSPNETNYFPAIDRYLVNELGRHYTQGEHCVPIHPIVTVDERNGEDILVWGDFWVFNYNQVGDTLKCVSGGNHPGRMHIRQTDNGFEVTGFDPVEDGSGFLQSAKKIFGAKYEAFNTIHSDEKARERLRAEGLAVYAKKHNLNVTMYQDYGWPAKKLPK